MTTKTDKPAAANKASQTEASTLALLAAMADTTWRMFVPPALFVSGGIWADLKYHTKPWMTVLGATIGLIIAISLVRQQLVGK